MPFPNKASQWKPGQSGNPAGRAKGVPTAATRYMRLLTLIQKVKNPVTKQVEEFTVAEIMDMKIIVKALKGDLAAYKEIVDRMEGRAHESLDMTTLGKELPTPIYGGLSARPEDVKLPDEIPLQGYDGDSQDIPPTEAN